MNSHDSSRSDLLYFDARMLRTLLCLLIAGLLCSPLASRTLAEPLVPAATTGGSGASHVPTAVEMLRGDLSPIVTEDIDVIVASATEPVASASVSVSEALRGNYSPIVTQDVDGIAVSAIDSVPSGSVSVSEMLRGDYSPIV